MFKFRRRRNYSRTNKAPGPSPDFWPNLRRLLMIRSSVRGQSKRRPRPIATSRNAPQSRYRIKIFFEAAIPPTAVIQEKPRALTITKSSYLGVDEGYFVFLLSVPPSRLIGLMRSRRRRFQRSANHSWFGTLKFHVRRLSSQFPVSAINVGNPPGEKGFSANYAFRRYNRAVISLKRRAPKVSSS